MSACRGAASASSLPACASLAACPPSPLTLLIHKRWRQQSLILFYFSYLDRGKRKKKKHLIKVSLSCCTLDVKASPCWLSPSIRVSPGVPVFSRRYHGTNNIHNQPSGRASEREHFLHPFNSSHVSVWWRRCRGGHQGEAECPRWLGEQSSRSMSRLCTYILQRVSVLSAIHHLGSRWVASRNQRSYFVTVLQ